jgi:hypothetical protein
MARKGEHGSPKPKEVSGVVSGYRRMDSIHVRYGSTVYLAWADATSYLALRLQASCLAPCSSLPPARCPPIS